MKKLNDGQEVPDVGFGAMIYDGRAAYQAVSAALSVGYRLLDTAEAYHNEVAVGRAINDSNVSRDQIVLTTKFWPSPASNKDDVLTHLNQSLAALEQDYVDLYLVHEPYGNITDVWAGMIEAKRQGKVKSIGVSNFTAAQIKTITAATGVAPAINQIESHPWHNQNDLVKVNLEAGIQPEAWAALAEGKHHIFHQLVLQQIADKHNKRIAQVVLRWDVDRGLIPLAKSVKPNRMQENLAIFDFKLDKADINAINSLNLNQSLWPQY
jgi:diketogulonate reductase-like aldo/keto reductase